MKEIFAGGPGEMDLAKLTRDLPPGASVQEITNEILRLEKTLDQPTKQSYYVRNMIYARVMALAYANEDVSRIQHYELLLQNAPRQLRRWVMNNKISACIRKGQFEQIRRVLDDMKMAGLVPDVSTFNQLIQSCSAIVEKLGDPGWALAVGYYKDLISTYAPRRRLRRNAKGEMTPVEGEEEGEEAPAATVAAAKPVSSTPPAQQQTPQASSAAVGAAVPSGDVPSTAGDDEFEPAKLLQPNRYTFANLLKVLVAEAKRGLRSAMAAIKDVDWVIAEQEKAGLPRDAFFWSILLTLANMTRQLHLVKQTFAHAVKECDLPAFNYNQYIFALGECGGTHEDLIETFGMLKTNKVPIEVNTVNALLAALKHVPTDPALPMRVLELMEQSRLRPDQRTITSAISYLGRLYDPVEMMKVWEFGKRHRVPVDYVMCRAILIALTHRNCRAYDVAAKLLPDLKAFISPAEFEASIELLKRSPHAKPFEEIRAREDVRKNRALLPD
jgi:pentatricopeptide repeat protein